MKKNIILISGNSKEDIKWQKKMTFAYSNIHNIKILIYDDLINNEETLKKELSKLKEIIKITNEYIIITRKKGILIAISGIVNELISPKMLICIDLPLEYINNKINNYDFINSMKQINKKTKVFIIENHNYKKYKEIQQFIPVITSEEYKFDKKIIDIIIKINDTNYDVCKVSSINIRNAIIKIDKNRLKFKFYNNWLSDANNKILIFCFKGEIYIAKRVNYSKAILEIDNFKILKDIIIKIKDKSKYNLNIEEPVYYKINREYGYIVSKYYGNDLNHLYYNNLYKRDNELKKTLTHVYNELIKNDIRYNGFLPRNIIVKDKNIYFIDFEDINKKSLIATETNLKIAWSYFFEINYNLKSNISFEDEFSKYFLNNNLLNKYKNPYDIAIKAESSYNNKNYRIDDSVNVLSNYLPFEVEIMLDVLIYESKLDKNNALIEFVCSLAQKVRILEIINEKYIVKNDIKEDMKNFFMLFKNKYNNVEYIDKIKKIIKLLEKIDN